MVVGQVPNISDEEQQQYDNRTLPRFYHEVKDINVPFMRNDLKVWERQAKSDWETVEGKEAGAQSRDEMRENDGLVVKKGRIIDFDLDKVAYHPKL